ncbi:MAG: hypothetical protein GX303_06960 [Clostridiales bacterium]|nr:hypothetical protein [Clostridiales bacterium]
MKFFSKARKTSALAYNIEKVVATIKNQKPAENEMKQEEEPKAKNIDDVKDPGKQLLKRLDNLSSKEKPTIAIETDKKEETVNKRKKSDISFKPLDNNDDLYKMLVWEE